VLRADAVNIRKVGGQEIGICGKREIKVRLGMRLTKRGGGTKK